MKITKSQKEAIVNEITRRLRKENQVLTEKFNKNHLQSQRIPGMLLRSDSFIFLDLNFEHSIGSLMT